MVELLPLVEVVVESSTSVVLVVDPEPVVDEAALVVDEAALVVVEGSVVEVVCSMVDVVVGAAAVVVAGGRVVDVDGAVVVVELVEATLIVGATVVDPVAEEAGAAVGWGLGVVEGSPLDVGASISVVVASALDEGLEATVLAPAPSEPLEPAVVGGSNPGDVASGADGVADTPPDPAEADPSSPEAGARTARASMPAPGTIETPAPAPAWIALSPPPSGKTRAPAANTATVAETSEACLARLPAAAERNIVSQRPDETADGSCDDRIDGGR